MMLEELQKKITDLKRKIKALPDSAVRLGMDEDYLADLENLEDEVKAFTRK